MSDREDQCRAAPDQVDEPCAEALSRGGLSFDSAMAPGGRTASTEGCICSVLASAAYRSGAPDETPFIDPRCPLHALHVP